MHSRTHKNSCTCASVHVCVRGCAFAHAAQRPSVCTHFCACVCRSHGFACSAIHRAPSIVGSPYIANTCITHIQTSHKHTPNNATHPPPPNPRHTRIHTHPTDSRHSPQTPPSGHRRAGLPVRFNERGGAGGWHGGPPLKLPLGLPRQRRQEHAVQYAQQAHRAAQEPAAATRSCSQACAWAQVGAVCVREHMRACA